MIAQAVQSTAFVGRSEELEALLDARRALARSRGSLVLVAGEPGIGKTRLLAQFLRVVARDTRPRNCAKVECLQSAEEPFGAFRRLFRNLGLEFPRHVADRAALFDAVMERLTAAAERRATVLAIDDLHWADRSSLDLLVALAPRFANKRLLLLGTYRSDEAADVRGPLFAALSQIEREATVVRVELEPLPEPQLREVVASALAGGSLATSVREAIVERSEGNPFFAEELLKAALEAGDPEAARLPRSIRAAISGNIAALTAGERRVVASAAVLGYRFDPALLALTTGIDVDTVLAVLARGRDLNVFVEEDDPRGCVRFRHALTRRAVYEGMLRYDARRTHERILRTLESLADCERFVDALAYHAWEAHDAEKVVLYNERAGEAAMALRALPEARTCFERACEFAVEPADRARLFERCARAAELHGSLHDADERYARALQLYESLGTYDRACDVVLALAVNRNNLGDRACVVAGREFLARNGLAITAAKRDDLLATLARLAIIQYDEAGTAELLGMVQRPDALPPRGRHNYVVARAELLAAAGERDAWIAIVPTMLATIDDVPPYNQLTGLYCLAQAASAFGCMDVAANALARADMLEARGEFRALLAHGRAVRAHVAWSGGDVAGARERIHAALSGTEAAVARQALALVAPLVAAETGDASLVPPEMEEELAEYRRAPTSMDDARILAAAATWSFARGETATAVADMQLALGLVTRPTPLCAEVLPLAAHILPEEATATLRALLEREDFLATEIWHAYATFATAVLESRFGDDRRAAVLAAEAAEAFDGYGWPLVAARARRFARQPGEDAAVVSPPGVLAALSEREQSIALLVTEGATNAQIGDALAIGTKTVEKHVSAIFRKLAVSRRSQIAALLARERPQASRR